MRLFVIVALAVAVVWLALLCAGALHHGPLAGAFKPAATCACPAADG